MHYIKPLKEEKIKQREARDEFQVIIKRAREIGFDYVIFRPPQTKISFGSRTDRRVLPDYDKIPKNLGPGEYELTYMVNSDHPTIKKVVAKTGYGSLAYRTIRFGEAELDLTDFYIKVDKIPIKKVYAKSNVKKKCNENSAKSYDVGDSSSVVPGPGTYTNRFKRKSIVQHSFGGKMSIQPAVQMICNQRNLSHCSNCGEKPIAGDFWINWRTRKEMCRKCMEKRRRDIQAKEKLWRLRVIKLGELDNFQMVRYCEFYHDHRQTLAAIRLLTPFELQQKYRLENYLSMFQFLK